MFEVFGEFNSAEEINKKAAELIEDAESLKKFAVENGFDEEDAEDYIDCGGVTAFCSPLMAAVGKLHIECKELGIKELEKNILNDWIDILRDMCADCDAYHEFADAVRKKGKNLSEFLAMLISYSFEYKYKVPDEIVRNVKIRMQPSKDSKPQQFKGPLYIGIPDKAKIRELAVKYYVGKGVS